MHETNQCNHQQHTLLEMFLWVIAFVICLKCGLKNKMYSVIKVHLLHTSSNNNDHFNLIWSSTSVIWSKAINGSYVIS